MSDTNRYFVMLLLSALGANIAMSAQSTPSVSGPDKVTSFPHFGRLAPVQIQAIQTVGKAVLSAKGTLEQDPEALALRDQLVALSADLDQATVVVTPTLTPTLQDSNAAGDSQASDSPVDKSAGVLRARMVKLRQQRLQMINAARQDRTIDRVSRLQALSTKSTELEQALTDALAASGSERFVKLSVLRNRLQIMTASDMRLQGHSRAISVGAADTTLDNGASWVSPTPTISTIVRHR